MVLMAILLGGGAIYQSHQQAKETAIGHAANITLVMQRGLQRHAEFFCSVLDSIGERYRQVLHFPVSGSELGSFLFTGGQANRYIVETAVLDKHGLLVSSSRSSPALLTNDFSDAPFFQAQQNADIPAGKLFLSKPIQLAKDYFVVVLSRRITDMQGNFAGVAMMVLDLAYFRSMLEGVDVGNNGVLSIYSRDATVYVRVPYDPAMVGRNLSSAPMLDSFLKQDSGHFFWKSVNDGVERLYAFHAVPGTNLVVFVGYAKSNIYNYWQKTLAILIIGSILLIFSALSFFRSMQSEFLRRHASEKTLTTLATIDGLTGLINRRSMDELMERHWQHLREGTLRQLSVIFIDVDFFKLYNDGYGHQSGDLVLAQVAAALRTSLARNEDGAARYGGEEFVVILPGSDAAGASKVAERIRAAVEQLALPHAHSRFGMVTISLGVAQADLQRHGQAEQLLAEADQALYAAKSAGRNRVEISSAI
ncbi:UNVERIFIED_ORG: diguanylate cyclase (GGDEF)-like protein [Herbaspirillum seropedicae]